MPGMNATGTKTESRTSVMARIGPVISAIAFLQQSETGRFGFSSITRSIFSTTTIASSTTIPMASTRASNETVLAEYPSKKITANVPTMDTGKAINGISVVPSPAEKQKYHEPDEHDGFAEGPYDLFDRGGDEDRRVIEDVICAVVRKAPRDRSHRPPNMFADLDRVRSGGLVNPDRRCRRTVEAAVSVLRFRAHFDTPHA